MCNVSLSIIKQSIKFVKYKEENEKEMLSLKKTKIIAFYDVYCCFTIV